MTKNILFQYNDLKKEQSYISRQILKLESQMKVNDDEALEILRNKYDELYHDILLKQKEIEDVIDTLEPMERNLIRYRYFDQYKWVSVCRKINYSYRQAIRIHNRILNKLNNL